jgi:ribosomal protein S18 acetylase RimI-like enzyme
MTRGAKAACVQVLSDNVPALRLYRRLGFGDELYRYHYRRKAA